MDAETPYRLFSLILCSGESLEAEFTRCRGFGGIEAIDTEFPYRVPIVDRGAIAVPLFADPISELSKTEPAHKVTPGWTLGIEWGERGFCELVPSFPPKLARS